MTNSFAIQSQTKSKAITSSAIFDAMAAPVTPSAGAPSFP